MFRNIKDKLVTCKLHVLTASANAHDETQVLFHALFRFVLNSLHLRSVGDSLDMFCEFVRTFLP